MDCYLDQFDIVLTLRAEQAVAQGLNAEPFTQNQRAESTKLKQVL